MCPLWKYLSATFPELPHIAPSRITSYNVCYTKLLRAAVQEQVAGGLEPSGVGAGAGDDPQAAVALDVHGRGVGAGGEGVVAAQGRKSYNFI